MSCNKEVKGEDILCRGKSVRRGCYKRRPKANNDGISRIYCRIKNKGKYRVREFYTSNLKITSN